MTNKLLLPPGPVVRRLEGLFIGMAGLLCFVVYFLIRFEVCVDAKCENLEITKFFAAMPEVYIVYGLAVMLVAVYLYTNEELNRLFRLGLELTAAIGVVLSGMIVFGMLKEVQTLT